MLFWKASHMISDRLAGRFQSWGRGIKSAHEQFKSLIREGVIEVGGKNWAKKPLQPIFDSLEKDLIDVLCVAEDGPRIRKVTFRQYWCGGRNALIFNVPFSLGKSIGNNDLDKILKVVMNDTSKRSNEDKFRDAVRLLREQRKAHYNAKPSIRIPLLGPDDDEEEWFEVFRDLMVELFSSKDMQRLKKSAYAFEIKRLESAFGSQHENRKDRRATRRCAGKAQKVA